MKDNLMRIIAQKNLREFWNNHPEAERPLREWVTIAKNASWQKPHDVKQKYPAGSAIGNGRFVFRFDKYRLITWISYEYFTIYIKWIGTHNEYEKIDPTAINAF